MQQLEKCLNMPQGVGILISTLLGSSIFIVPALVATIAGTHSLLAWIVTILLMLPVAFTFSNLGTTYPNAGGTAFFIKQATGEKMEHFTSWLYLSVMPLGPPVVIITGANYLGSIINANDDQIFMICTGMLGSMFLINFVGLKFVGTLQTIISVVIVCSLLLIIFIAFSKNPEMIKNVDLSFKTTDFALITQAVPVIFWCFVGLEAIVHLSAEFRNVEKDFPKTIIISMFTVGSICLSLSLIVLEYGVYGSESLNLNYLVPLVKQLIGEKSTVFIAVIGFFTCFATINLYILSFSRMLLSMSDGKIISSWFSKLSKNSVPINSLILCYFCVYFTIFLKYTFQIELKSLILYANSVFVFLYLLASISGCILLHGLKKFLAVLSAIFCFYIFFSLGGAAIYAILILIFSVLWDSCLHYNKEYAK